MNSELHRPELESDSFFLEGGEVGVLLFHGLTATTMEVRLLATALHEEGYTVSAPLLPGHGTSPEQLNRTHRNDWLNCAESAYQELKKSCTKVFVGGTSTGALIAIHLAAQHPKICGILAYAPAMKLIFPWWQKVLLVLLSPFVFAYPKKGLDVRELWQGYKVYPLKAAAQLLFLQQEVFKLFPEIYHPILVIQGKNDTTLHPESSGIILQESSSAVKKFSWMKDSGHVLLLEKGHWDIEQQTLQFMSRIL